MGSSSIVKERQAVLHAYYNKLLQSPLVRGEDCQGHRPDQMLCFNSSHCSPAFVVESVLFRELLGQDDNMTLYPTLSACSLCALKDRRGVEWVPATVKKVSHSNLVGEGLCTC